MLSSPAPCLYSHHSLSRIRHTSPMSVNVTDNVNVTITPCDVSAKSFLSLGACDVILLKVYILYRQLVVDVLQVP